MAASHPLCWRDLSASLPASLRQPQPHPITSPPHLDRFHVRPAHTFLPLPALQKEARERVHLRLPPKTHYHPVLWGPWPAAPGQRPGGAFRLAEVGTVGFRTRGLSPPLPKGEGLQGTSGLTQSPGLTPLALQVASCLSNAWERAVLPSSVLHVSFPKGGAW